MTPVKPPKGLPTEGAALWRTVARHWADDGLEPDPRERRLLADACREAAMLAILETALDEAIEGGELIVKGSMGQPVVNSLVDQCRRSRSQVAALLGKLGLDAPPEELPALGGGDMTPAQAGRLGAMRRHYGAGGI